METPRDTNPTPIPTPIPKTPIYITRAQKAYRERLKTQNPEKYKELNHQAYLRKKERQLLKKEQGMRDDYNANLRDIVELIQVEQAMQAIKV